MSRIGKKPIDIPEDLEIELKDGNFKAKGQKGELSLKIPPEISLEKKENQIFVSLKNKENGKEKALWGTYRALLQNIIKGVSEGFEKKLEIQGVGYKASLKGDKNLQLNLGFSHPVELEIPDDLKVAVEKNIITVSGIDKYEVGEFSAKIRKIRPPEPYKGKGVRYLGEKVRRKEGKKAATSAGT